MSIFERLKAFFVAPQPIRPLVMVPDRTTKLSTLIGTKECRNCKQQVKTWRTYGDGSVFCVPCSSRFS